MKIMRNCSFGVEYDGRTVRVLNNEIGEILEMEVPPEYANREIHHVLQLAMYEYIKEVCDDQEDDG